MGGSVRAGETPPRLPGAEFSGSAASTRRLAVIARNRPSGEILRRDLHLDLAPLVVGRRVRGVIGEKVLGPELVVDLAVDVLQALHVVDVERGATRGVRQP